ncbi:MAG: ABC transporter substrate-binding protein, partial [Leptospiraceae bacterium]|nr:ABC transporter substrate-binding protein [Leptospiraceae bacterium]
MKISRKDMLKLIPASLGALALGTQCKPQGQAGGGDNLPEINWKLASSFPRSLDTIYGAAEVMAEYVRKMTNGKFNIRVYPAGELVPGLQVMDA